MTHYKSKHGIKSRLTYTKIALALFVFALLLVGTAFLVTQPSAQEKYIKENCRLLNGRDVKSGIERSEIWSCPTGEER